MPEREDTESHARPPVSPIFARHMAQTSDPYRPEYYVLLRPLPCQTQRQLMMNRMHDLL